MKKLASFFKLVWKVSPSYVLILVMRALVSGAKLMLNVILPKFLVDELTGAKDVQMLLLFGALIILNNVGMTLLENTFKRFVEVKETYVRNAMNKKMAEKIMNLEYSYLEDPYYLDLKERAVFAISNQDAIAQLISCAASVFSGAVTLIGLITILATLGPVLIIVLVIGIAIMLLLYGGMAKSLVFFQNEIIPLNRRFGYYMGLSWDKQYQKDIRLYDMEDMIYPSLIPCNSQISG